MNPALRNPAWSWRVLLVSGVFALPGSLVGAMAGLWLGDFATWVVLGMLFGAASGALMEGTQAGDDRSDDDPTVDDLASEAFGYLVADRHNDNRLPKEQQ